MARRKIHFKAIRSQTAGAHPVFAEWRKLLGETLGETLKHQQKRMFSCTMWRHALPEQQTGHNKTFQRVPQLRLSYRSQQRV
jgi:hypothetical protein